jgi:RHS repeat-associated protein
MGLAGFSRTWLEDKRRQGWLWKKGNRQRERRRTLRVEELERRELLSVVANITADQPSQVERLEGTFTFTITITDCPPDLTYGEVYFEVTGTADPNCDYQVSGFLPCCNIIFYGNGSQSATVTIENDPWREENETITVRLTSGCWFDSSCCAHSVDFENRSATVTIIDDDQWVFSIEAADDTASEMLGDLNNPGRFRISRSISGEADTTYGVKVWYNIGGTASQGDDYPFDYKPLPGVEGDGCCGYGYTGYVIFPANSSETMIEFPVDVIEDAPDPRAEVKETVVLTLSQANPLWYGGCEYGNYQWGQQSATVSIHDNDWIVVSGSPAVEPMSVPENATGLESEMGGARGAFIIRLLDGNENFEEVNVGYRTSNPTGTATIDDDPHWDNEPPSRDYQADADGFLTAGQDALPLSGQITIPVGQNQYVVSFVPWYDRFQNESTPPETVILTISGNNVHQTQNSATLLILEPIWDPKPCVGCCGQKTGEPGVSCNVAASTGGLGASASGTRATYYAHFASGQETVVAFSPLQLTNGQATLEFVEAKLVSFGSNSLDTTIWFDAAEASALSTYAFAFPVDVSTLNTGAYPWTVQLIQHYSDNSTQTITLSGKKNVFNTLNSPMGPGWFAFGVARLIPDGSDVLLLRGGLQRFKPNGTGGWVPDVSDDTSAYTLTGNWYTGFTLRAKDGTVDYFSPAGLITRTVDPAGNQTFYHYDESNRLVSIDAPEGDTVYLYDEQTGWLSQIIRPDGVVSTYTHDAQGRITQITQPDPDGNGPLPAPVTTFEYAGPNGLLSAIVFPDGSRETYEYDHALRLKKIIRADGSEETYVSFPAAALVNLASGEGTLQNPAALRDTADLRVSSTVGGVTTTSAVDRWGFPLESVDGEGQTTRYIRNAAGQVVQVIEPDPDGEGPLTPSITRYEYDSKGNRIKMVLPDGGIRRWEYDPQWNVVTKYIDERGITTLYKIDSQTGYVLESRIVVGQVDSPGNSESDDVVTHYTYTDANDGTLIGLVETETDALGTVTRYQYNSRGQVIQITYAFGTSQEASVTYEYDPDTGKLLAEVDELGRRTEYQYNALGQLVRKILPDPDDEGPLASPVYEYAYDAMGNLAAETDPLGNVTQYVYDARGRLVRTIQPDPDGPNGPLASPITQQFYDTAGRLSHVIDPVGTVTEYAYDNADRQTAVYHGILLDNADGGYAETGPNWSDWEEGYRNLSRVHPTVTGDPTAAATWTFSYLLVGMQYEVYATWEADPDNAQDVPFAIFAGDTSGQPLATLTVDQSLAPGQTGPSRNIAGRTFRKLGTFTVNNPTLIVRLANNSTTAGKNVVADAVVVRLASPLSQTFYDNAGRVTGTLDPLGRLTAYEYDAAGRQTKIIQPDPDRNGPLPAPMTQYVYNTGGQLVQVIDPLGRVTAYEYDALGRRSRVILPDPDGPGPLTAPETLYQYDKLGRLVAVTDPLGNVTTYEYDARGRQIRVTQPDPDGNGPLEAPVTQYVYDAAGQLLQLTDPLGRITTYEYDGLGRQIKITQSDPDGEGPELAPWTTFTYDAAGRLVSQADRLNHTTTFTYDNLGRLISQTDANGAETTFSYDPAGRRLSLTDPVGNTTTWVYDALGRTVAETNELGNTRYFVYDAAGYLVRRIDRLGRVRQFQYDNLGRNTAEIWYNNVEDADADQNRQRTITFSYDLVGQLTSVDDVDADYTYSYDALGRVTTLTHSIVGLVPMVTFTQAYDAAGRRTELKTQINGTAEFVNQWTYDALGRVVRITQGPQPGGRAVAEKRVDFSYDAAGQLTALARYADLAGTQLVAESSYSYDQAGRLRNLRHFQGQTTFVEYTWNFDAANRMTQYINSVDGTADYTSDAAGQLTAADYDYQTDESYQYDSNGNRVLANGSTYTTGANNRLLSDGTYRYLYDAEGNRTHRFIDNNQNGQLDAGDTDITQYTWDHRNRLVKVEHRLGYAAAVDKVVEYFYDYQNRWVRKALDSDGDGHLDGRRIFIYDGNQIVMDFRRANSQDMQIGHLRQRYLWGPAVDQVLAEEAVDGGTDDLVQWTLTDHLNTVRDIARFDPQTGATTVVNHLVYDAFGKVTAETNPAVDSLFLFTARPFDPDTQLQNNLNRWYDARVGRWLSEDPVGFAGGDGNLYRYVGNGPSGRFDPVGLREPEDPFDAVMLGIITPQEAQYFYNRSREELREYIKWRLREGRDAIQVTDPPASTKFPIGRKPLGWVLAQLWPLPGERCARCGPEQLRELGEAIERVAKNTWIFDFWPNGCERWAMAFERNWADAKVCSPCLAEHNIGFRTASAIGGGHAYYYFLLCDRVTTVRVDHWIYQFFAYGGTTCFEIVR